MYPSPSYLAFAGYVFQIMPLQVSAATIDTRWEQNNLTDRHSNIHYRTPDAHHSAAGTDTNTHTNWKSLFDQIGGRLHVVEPLARPCFSRYNGDNVTINEARCIEVQDNWLNGSARTSTYSGYFHAFGDNCISDAAETCALDLTDPTKAVTGSCNTDNLAGRYVEITGPFDVQAAFRFAREYNVSLSIKSSGHDYLSRSSGRETLALWTRNLKELEFHEAFVPRGTQAEPVLAVTMGSGINADEATAFGAQHGITLLAGSSGTVSVAGGWSMFGGHSVLAPRYGLGADRILEITIVTPDGAIRTCNPAQNQDLFWALRGAGGGTFGVVLNATIKAEPVIPVTFAELHFEPTPENQNTFLKLLIDKTPEWSSEGWGGVMSSSSMTMIGPHLDPAASKRSLASAVDFVTAQNGTVVFQQYSTYHDFFAQNIALSSGDIGQGALVSFRVLPKRLHETDAGKRELHNFLLNKVKKGLAPTMFMTTPAQYHYADNSTSINPVWRSSYWDVGFTESYAWNATNDERRAVATSIQNISADLTALAPDGAAYPNEADPWTKDWQHAFWGDNYAPLLAIKNRYDPHGLLNCWKCVAFEDSWIQNDSRYKCMAAYEGLVR